MFKGRKPFKVRLPMPDTSQWRCLRCGCTERHACPPICWWVGRQLCSSCATAEELYIHSVAEKLGQLADLFNGQFELPKGKRLKDKGPEDSVGPRDKLHWKDANVPKIKYVQTKKTGPAAKSFNATKFAAWFKAKKGVTKKQLAQKYQLSLPKVGQVVKKMKSLKLITQARSARKSGKGGSNPMLYFGVH